MPRLRIIILAQDDPRTYQYALWADVPASRQSFYVDASAKSAWKDALASDLAALQAGQVVERVDKLGMLEGSTLALARASLQASWQSFQDEITSKNPWLRYGTTWDGTTWTA